MASLNKQVLEQCTYPDFTDAELYPVMSDVVPLENLDLGSMLKTCFCCTSLNEWCFKLGPDIDAWICDLGGLVRI